MTFTSHMHAVLHLRIEIMKERDMKNVWASFPPTSQEISFSSDDSIPKLFRKHLCATTKLTLGNPCTAVFLQSVQMCSAITAQPSHMGLWLIHTPCFPLWHTGVFKSLWPAFSCKVILALIKGCTKIMKGKNQPHGNLGLVLGEEDVHSC